MACDESPPRSLPSLSLRAGPRDSSEAGLLRFWPRGDCVLWDAGTRLSLLDRADDEDGLVELPSSSITASPSLYLSPPLLRRDDLERVGVEAGEGPIGVSGTGCPAAPGTCGGRMSGSWAPPTFGTSGSLSRTTFASSSFTQMNWTNAVTRQQSLPKSSVREALAVAGAPNTSEYQLRSARPGCHHHSM